jgi:tRNA-2-methylthio-N6-dimethylallyladenosine synthase
MSAMKKKRPDLVLGILGCLAQKEGAGLLKRFPGLDLIIGPREVGRIQEFLHEIEDSQKEVVSTALDLPPLHAVEGKGYFNSKVTGFISIMQGCNNFCSYCIVPFVRGREVSRSPGDLILEAKNLLSEGVKEITFLGQNVNSYRWGENDRWCFSDLLRTLSGLDGLKRIRFTTSHPKDLSDDLIACFRDLKNLCSHIHLPFQAGSNRVLQRMRREYSRERYLGLVEKLRDVRPDIAITGDVMVGFPGETPNDFELTLDLIRKVGFDSLFSFKYSDRKGTLAEKMDGKVEDAEKASRLHILQGIQREISLTKNKILEGQIVEILVEGQSKKGDQLTGRTSTNKIVNFTSDDSLLGKIIKIKLKECFINSLRGERIN